MSLLVTESLAVGYRRHRVLDQVEVEAQPGRLVAVVGPNGSGKSTLLRTLIGLQRPLGGRVLVEGRPHHRLRRAQLARTIATVLTDTVEVQHLTVGGLVALGRHPHLGAVKILREVDHTAVRHALDLVGIGELADRAVARLSDGQRQRALIARALAQEPRLLLLDEPTSFLDPVGRVTVLSLLARLAHREGLCVVVCTHEVELAVDYADELWIVGDGKVHAGEPGQCLRDGTLTRPFETPGISFDSQLGRFREMAPDIADSPVGAAS